MTTIHIIHCSLLGYQISHYIKTYLQKHHLPNIKIVSKRFLSKKNTVPIYFIIKSPLLTSELMHTYLRDIRYQSDLAKIIIIGNNINYEELFKNHYT